MAKRRAYLIDGHSMIFSVRELRDLHGKVPRRARDLLCSSLERFGDQSGDAVVIVFDGSGVSLSSQMSRGGVQIVYTPKGGAADDVIQEFAGRYGSIFDLTVVTKDSGERVIVEGFGVATMKPENFLQLLERSEALFYQESRKYLRNDE